MERECPGGGQRASPFPALLTRSKGGENGDLQPGAAMAGSWPFPSAWYLNGKRDFGKKGSEFTPLLWFMKATWANRGKEQTQVSVQEVIAPTLATQTRRTLVKRARRPAAPGMTCRPKTPGCGFHCLQSAALSPTAAALFYTASSHITNLGRKPPTQHMAGSSLPGHQPPPLPLVTSSLQTQDEECFMLVNGEASRW